MFDRKKSTDENANTPRKRARKPQEIKAWVESHREEFSLALENLRRDMNIIQTLPDAGERYLELTKLEDKITPIKEEAIAKMAEGLSRKSEYINNIFVGAASLLSLPAGGLGILIFFGMIRETKEKGEWDRRAATTAAVKKLEFFKAFDLFQEETQDLKEEILKKHMSNVAHSPHFDRLYNSFPEVKGAFIRAAAKRSVIDEGDNRLDKPNLKKPTNPNAIRAD